MTALITGITGFAGGHLAEALLRQEGVSVHGISRQGRWAAWWRHLTPRVNLIAADVCDRAAVEAVLRQIQPNQIYHLAGYAHVGQSLREPDAAWAGNFQATRSLYDAVVGWGGSPRIVYVSSGQIYGDPETPDPAYDEKCLLRPGTPYAASKAAADLLSYQYTRTPGLDIVRVRPFNHIGPGQSPQFAVASFARQLAAIAQGRLPPRLETGNLASRRDLTDVRDTVRAYVLLAQHGRRGEAYNVGSGQALAMQEVLDRLISLSGLQVEVRTRPDLVRSTDLAAIRADAGKLRRETGWQPSVPLDQTLTDMLEFWRSYSSSE